MFVTDNDEPVWRQLAEPRNQILDFYTRCYYCAGVAKINVVFTNWIFVFPARDQSGVEN